MTLGRLHEERDRQRDLLFMDIALRVKAMSTCLRHGVGCVITDYGRTSIVAMGYNGNAAGFPNSCDDPGAAGACGCIHAEVNALIKAPYHQQNDLILYTSTAPCLNCAKLLVNSKVSVVKFSNPYRNDDGIKLLIQAEFEVMQIVFDHAGAPTFIDTVREGVRR